MDGQAVALATKEDVDRARIALGSELKAEIQEVRTDLKVLDTRMRAFEKIGWAVVLGVLTLLVKAFLLSAAAG